LFATVSKAIAGLRWIEQTAASDEQQQYAEHRSTEMTI
jgi:hypothetical protein